MNHESAPVAVDPSALGLLLDASPGACLLVDGTGRVVQANAEAIELLGYAAEAIRGLDVDAILPPDTRWADADGLFLARHRDGGSIAVRAVERGLAPKGQAPVRLIAIRELVRIHELLEAAEILGASFRESPLESITLDHEGRVLGFNRAAERTFGFRHEDLMGKDLAEFIIPHRFREAHHKGMARLAESGTPRVLGKQLELGGLRADGSEIPVELTIARVEGLHPPVFTGYVRDISERKRFQEQLVTQEKLASLGTLTAGVAHEIKNPLNFINNFASLTEELVAELDLLLAGAGAALFSVGRAEIADLCATIRDNVGKIVHHGRRADSIVKGMLMHARSGSEAVQATDLNALAAEYLNLAYHAMRGTDHDFSARLESDFADPLPPVQALPQALSRVVLNLVGNALYAVNQRRRQECDPGYQPTVSLGTRDLGEHVQLRVRDNGPGIDSAKMEKVFEPFFTTKPPGEGTGLGLSLSYDIVVRVHGGTLTLASEPGVFTEFVVTLPKAGRIRPKEPA